MKERARTPRALERICSQTSFAAIYGFELMMAPYSIAHMKIGLKLRETGYSFLSSERAQIYLTNTLEQPKEVPPYFETMAPALAHEAIFGHWEFDKKFTQTYLQKHRFLMSNLSKKHNIRAFSNLTRKIPVNLSKCCTFVVKLAKNK